MWRPNAFILNGPLKHSRLVGTIFIAGASWALLCAPMRASADTPPTDEQALEARVTTALGGASRLNALRSLRAVGRMEGISGFPGTYRVEARAPDSRIETWDIRYLRQTTAVSGRTGWQRVTNVRELAGDEIVRWQRDARFNLLFRLMQEDVPFTVGNGECALQKPAILMRFKGADGLEETFGIDPDRYLPLCYLRSDPYEEGLTQIRVDYSDYRRVKGLMLPFAIHQLRPDISLKIVIDSYEINAAVDPQIFLNPEAANFTKPVELQLATLPKRVYKEIDGHYEIGPQRYWGMYFDSSESWSFDLMVKEKYGRWIEPVSATAELYASGKKISTKTWSASALHATRRVPIARFTPQGEIYGFRHNFTEPGTQNGDRILYTFVGRAADGRVHSSTLDVPVTRYEPKTKLIFPLKGNFMVTGGHEFHELNHKYERSQQFAIDVIALGENFEYAHNGGATAEDWVGYGRREIIAPAAGRVVFASNHIPDGMVKAEYLKMEDGITAIAGNLVIIDHGNGEFSSLGHLHHGSVRVKVGDHVEQGQVIALLGTAGSPSLPHLHYQLQDANGIFGGDGLPLLFTNIERVGWIGGRRASPVEQPRAGVFMMAR